MEQLTAQQAKMVIEYFAAQAAEDMPIITSYAGDTDKHMWMTRMQASIAIEKQIGEFDWDELVTYMIAAQSFDRDPDGYLHANGYRVTAAEREYVADTFEDEVSFAIDNAYGNAGE